MQIEVSKSALDWFKQEWNLQQGSTVRFFVKYGGDASVQQGFSLGIIQELAVNVCAQTTQDGITFFVRDEDLWYFNGLDLLVDYDAADDEVLFAVR